MKCDCKACEMECSECTHTQDEHAESSSHWMGGCRWCDCTWDGVQQ